MSPSFGQILKDHLADQGMTQAAFAAAVGRSPGYLSMVLKGHRGPPDDLENWAKVLKLKGDAKHALLEAGYLELTPDYIRTRYLKLKS